MNVEAILNDIRSRHGALTPAIVLEVAKDKNHPLHNRFEWNNANAAEKYRLVQAAQIIRSVKVRITDDGEGPTRDVRAFIHLPADDVDDDGALGEYVPVAEVATNPRLTAIAAANMKRELNALTRRYSGFNEYVELLAAEAERLAS